MKNRSVSMCILVMFLFGLVAIGNVFGASAPPVELKIVHFAPPIHLIHKDVLVPWTKMLEERTQGKVKGVLYPGEVLGKAKDHYDMVVAGTADACYVYIGANPGRFPLHGVYELPFMLSNPRIASRIMWENFEKEPAMKKEFSDVKVLAITAIPAMQIHSAKKPVKTLEDLKGMKIRTLPGPVTMKTIAALGAVPVTMAPADTYVALERGTIDAGAFPWEAYFSMKTGEVTKYHTEANLWSGVWFFVMNKKKWESLPPDVQKAIDGISGAWLSDWVGSVWEKDDIASRDKIKNASGHQFITLSKEEWTKWQGKTKSLRDEWVSEVESKGLPAKKVLDSTLSLLQKYSK